MFPPLPWVLGYSGTPFVPLCHAVFPRNEVNSVEGPRINRLASCLFRTLAVGSAIQKLRWESVLGECGVEFVAAHAEEIGVILGSAGVWRWSATMPRASAPAVGWSAPAGLGDVAPLRGSLPRAQYWTLPGGCTKVRTLPCVHARASAMLS